MNDYTLVKAESAVIEKRIQQLQTAASLGREALSITAQSLTATEARLIAAVLTVRIRDFGGIEEEA